MARKMIAVFYAVLPVMALSACSVDSHHPENGGYYIEGISGVDSSQRDTKTGRRADKTAWVKDTYYPHGEMKKCEGQFCSEEARTKGEPQYVVAHTCARLRFSYDADSGSTVYEMPDKDSFDNCDFTNAYLRGKADAGKPHFDYMIEEDHEQKVYYFASKDECKNGQKVAVTVVDDYANNALQCKNMGTGSSRIQHCDCDHQLKGTTLIDPCHTAFANACLADMPDDKTCCPDPSTAKYEASTRKYKNGGTCIPKSAKDKMMKVAEETVALCKNDKSKCDEYVKMAACPSRYRDPDNYDPKCDTVKAVEECKDATGDVKEDCKTNMLYIMYERAKEYHVMDGACRGPGGALDKLNSKHVMERSLDACKQDCQDQPHCVGFTYHQEANGGECIVHGPGAAGSCTDSSLTSPAACAGKGKCSDESKLSEDSCGSCSADATTKVTCEGIGGTWTKEVWKSAGEAWNGPEDPWTGEWHSAVIIKSAAPTSGYKCYDKDPNDHEAKCTGSQVCIDKFKGKDASEQVAANCPSDSGCTFTAAAKGVKVVTPHAQAIQMTGYKVRAGACRGPGNAKVNGKYSNKAGASGGPPTQKECAAECTRLSTCVGYAHSTAWCVIYGAGIDENPGDQWTADNHDETTIEGPTKPNAAYICVVKSGDPSPPGGDSSVSAANQWDTCSGLALVMLLLASSFC